MFETNGQIHVYDSKARADNLGVKNLSKIPVFCVFGIFCKFLPFPFDCFSFSHSNVHATKFDLSVKHGNVNSGLPFIQIL